MALGLLHRLSGLSLSGNPLQSPPTDILQQGTKVGMVTDIVIHSVWGGQSYPTPLPVWYTPLCEIHVVTVSYLIGSSPISARTEGGRGYGGRGGWGDHLWRRCVYEWLSR